MEGFGSATPGAHACLVAGKTNPRRIVRVTGFQGAPPTMPNCRKSDGMPGTLRGGGGGCQARLEIRRDNASRPVFFRRIVGF